MIFRLSAKLATKLKVAPKTSLPLDANPFADWSAHLFVADRTQYILITNTASLYSVVLFGRGITDDGQFLDAALSAMRHYMASDGTEFIFRKFIAPASGTVSFSKALNRSVIGSMNDLAYHATFWLVERELSPFDTAFKLNEIPFSALRYKNAREVLMGLEVSGDAAGTFVTCNESADAETSVVEQRIGRLFAIARKRFFPDWDVERQWEIVVGRRRRWDGEAGYCSSPDKRIYIDPKAIERMPDDGVLALVIHEICHDVSNSGHAQRWLEEMDRAGGMAEAANEHELARMIYASAYAEIPRNKPWSEKWFKRLYPRVHGLD